MQLAFLLNCIPKFTIINFIHIVGIMLAINLPPPPPPILLLIESEKLD